MNLLSKFTGLFGRSGSLQKSNGGPHSNMITAGESYWWNGSSYLTGIFGGGGTPAAGIAFTDEQAMAVTAVYACSRAIAENLASLPGLVYEQQAKQRNLDRGSIPWQLLHDEPNPEMDSMTFWELITMRLENRGNAFVEIERDKNDNPIALWPIHNSRVEPYRNREDGRIEWRIGTDLMDPRTDVYRYYTIPDRDMLNFVGFGGNGYLAPGTIPCGQEQISFAIATHQYGSSFFKQGARPAAAVEHPGYIDDPDQRAEFRADINNAHAGRENWHKVAVLWNGSKWKEMQYGPDAAKFIESEQFSDKRICQMYRVPPAIVQIFDDYKFSSVDAMLQSFVMTCLRPTAIRIERAVNRRVLKYRDSRGRLVDAFGTPKLFEFLLEAMLRGDAKKQAETLEIKRRNGVLNANEWRALDNDAPIGEQGDYYILPGGFGRLDLIQGPGAKDESQPAKQSDNQGKETQSQLRLPDYDPHAKIAGENVSLIEAVESKIPAGSYSRGGSVADVDSLAKEMGDEVRDEAIQRIESVANNELTRIQRITDDKVRADKLADLRQKHRERLVSALRPAAGIYGRMDCYATKPQDAIAEDLADSAIQQFFNF